MNLLLLSAAVKKILVRFVSTLTTSSESSGTSSLGGGVAVGEGSGFWFSLILLARLLSCGLSDPVVCWATGRAPTNIASATKANATESLHFVPPVINFFLAKNYGLTESAIAL